MRIGILWPEIRILRRAGDGHALEVSSACRAGLALDAIRWRGRCRWGMPPLAGEAVEGSVPGVLWCVWCLVTPGATTAGRSSPLGFPPYNRFELNSPLYTLIPDTVWDTVSCVHGGLDAPR